MNFFVFCAAKQVLEQQNLFGRNQNFRHKCHDIYERTILEEIDHEPDFLNRENRMQVQSSELIDVVTFTSDYQNLRFFLNTGTLSSFEYQAQKIKPVFLFLICVNYQHN